MAWVKIPAANHPVFLAAVPKDPRVKTLKMFGGLAGMVNGNMFGGLFGKSIVVKLSAEDQREAMQLDGAEPFDPMGNGRLMKDMIFMPESVLDDDRELRSWLRRSLEYTATLPPKAKKPPKRARAQAPATKSPAPPKQSPAKPRPAKQSPTKQPKPVKRSPAKRSKR
jgi:TfoX/Sxy family transcriptional regulator of competence genes